MKKYKKIIAVTICLILVAATLTACTSACTFGGSNKHKITISYTSGHQSSHGSILIYCDSEQVNNGDKVEKGSKLSVFVEAGTGYRLSVLKFNGADRLRQYNEQNQQGMDFQYEVIRALDITVGFEINTTDPYVTGVTVKHEGADKGETMTHNMYDGATTVSFTADVVGGGGASSNVTWSVNAANTAGATINSSGVLTVASVGTVTVTATSVTDNTKFDAIVVTVINFSGAEPYVVSVTVKHEGVDKGEAMTHNMYDGATTVSFTADVVYGGGALSTVNWSVNTPNTAGATINSSGVLTVASVGTVTVTATSVTDNTKFDTIVVTITNVAPPIVWDFEDLSTVAAAIEQGNFTSRITTIDPTIFEGVDFNNPMALMGIALQILGGDGRIVTEIENTPTTKKENTTTDYYGLVTQESGEYYQYSISNQDPMDFYSYRITAQEYDEFGNTYSGMLIPLLNNMYYDYDANTQTYNLNPAMVALMLALIQGGLGQELPITIHSVTITNVNNVIKISVKAAFTMLPSYPIEILTAEYYNIGSTQMPYIPAR